MMDGHLEPEHFDAFFRAIHGFDPFPWQSRLARRVADRGWPQALDVPTGAGKTAAIDVAVFHLALECRDLDERRAPVRIAFVVDRRLVVDDAYVRAMRIADAIASATSGVLGIVADRLRLLAEPRRRPLEVARLRGGLAKEPDWARTPAQPTVLVSTVDQVGSRLLFRGYGVSDRMRPVHAGLLGLDTVLLLDEAHLSQPLVQTANAIGEWQRGDSFDDRGGRSELRREAVRVVTLSATQTAIDPFQIDGADIEHPVLGTRLFASKPAELLTVNHNADDQGFVDALVSEAWKLSAAYGSTANVVAVVVNRVKRARAVFESLKQRAKREGARVDVALLIGRTRDLDRETRLKELLPRMRASDREQGKPLLVVATQCVEAGADLDFDALVTEVAPLDALRQRFGRLNRMGRPIEAKAIVAAARDQLGVRAVDPLYGPSSQATWALLQSSATKTGATKKAKLSIDFGIQPAQKWLPGGEGLTKVLCPREDAPVVLPAFIRAWSQTSPIPAADPEAAAFLHGPEAGPPDVAIAWRADLEADRTGDWKDRVRACPPSSLETIAVPIWEAKRWLRRSAEAEFADVEGQRPPDDEVATSHALSRKALRWRGPDDDGTGVIRARDVAPGDTLVVPASYGGCDRWGWNPSQGDAVTDLAREANQQHRARDILRLSPLLLAVTLEAEGVDGHDARARAVMLRDKLHEGRNLSNRTLLEELGHLSWLPPSWLEFIQNSPRPRVYRTDTGAPIALERRHKGLGASDATTEDDESCRAPLRAVPLAEHSKGVKDVAMAFARTALGGSSVLVEAIGLAGYLHDAGKAHPSFRKWMYGGDELAAIAGPALAKSGLARIDLSARRRAGLPPGARHEAASLRFALAHPSLRDSARSDLVLWLIGTHHGYGRPFFPAVAWPPPDETFTAQLGNDEPLESAPGPQPEDPGSGWPNLFDALRDHYGPWGLAWLEAILRLADHRRSEAEQNEEGGQS